MEDASWLIGGIKLYLLCAGGYCAYILMGRFRFLEGLKDERWRNGIKQIAAIGLMVAAWWLMGKYTWEYSPLAKCRDKMEEVTSLYSSLDRYDLPISTNFNPDEEFRCNIMEYIHSPSTNLTPVLKELDQLLYDLSNDMQPWHPEYNDDPYEDY